MVYGTCFESNRTESTAGSNPASPYYSTQLCWAIGSSFLPAPSPFIIFFAGAFLILGHAQF